MLCGDGVLVLAMEAPEEHIGQAEEIVGSHLVRFGGEDELVVEWVRAT